MARIQENINEVRDYKSQFRNLAEKVALYFNQKEIKTIPFKDPYLSSYSVCSPEAQKAALDQLEVFHRSIEMCNNSGIDFNDSKKSLWYFLGQFGLLPCDDMFQFINNEDVLEVYDAKEGKQIWRNTNFMKICSYTIEEMFCHSWQERYERSEADTNKILDAVGKVLNPNNRDIIAAMIPDHEFIEKFSEEQLKLKARHDYFFPLFAKSGEPIGFVVNSRVKILESANEIKFPKKNTKDGWSSHLSLIST